MDFAAPLITHAELVAAGLGPNEIRRLVTTAELHKVRRGVYTRSRVDGSAQHLQLLHATLAVVDPGNVASHATAALLHSLPFPKSHLDRIWMTRRSSGHGDHAKNLVVRATPIDDGEVEVLGGVTVTNLVRTTTDLARTLPLQWSVAVVDAALRLGASRQSLQWSLGHHVRLPGIRKARAAVKFGDALAESPAESISRFFMWQAGIPKPELQTEHFNADGRFVARTDFFWPDWGVCGEVDGKWKYDQLLRPGRTAADAVMAEKRRDEGLRQLGYWPTHWDWAIANDQKALASLLWGAQRQSLRAAG